MIMLINLTLTFKSWIRLGVLSVAFFVKGIKHIMCQRLVFQFLQKKLAKVRLFFKEVITGNLF